MAFNQFQIDELNKIEGFGKAYEKGSKQAAKVAGDVALLMIPGLGTIKLARAGGKLTQSAMEFVKRAKKMHPNAKINPKPTAAQVSNAKPMSGVTLKKPTDVAVSSLKPRSRATAPGGKPTTTAASKPKVRVSAGTASKPTPKATTPKSSVKPAAKPKPKTKPKSKVGDRPQRAAAALAAITALASAEIESRKREQAKAAESKKTTPKSRAKPSGTNKGADPKKAKPKARGPQTRGSVAPQKTTPRKSGPSTRSGAKRGATKTITASKDVGFGPKGNIFPKNAEDRARLMRLYGGTGSAAAKAAAAGKQGTLKKGKK
tara:strand:- start:17 stop:967 length:951 start_codon:yes stop_codon:yes gene_type:complete